MNFGSSSRRGEYFDPVENCNLRIIGQTGREGKGENQFSHPRGVCIDSETKEVFVVDCNNHRVIVYHLPSLAFVRQIGKGVIGFGSGTLNNSGGICIDTPTNQLFLADTNNHRIAVFNSKTGLHTRTIGGGPIQGSLFGQLSRPYGVCIDRGLLYVADYDNNRVQVFDKETGEALRIIGDGFGTGPGQLHSPITVTVDPTSARLFVADYKNNRVQVYNTDTGLFLQTIGDVTNTAPENMMRGPRGLCFSLEANLLFVSDRENHRIQLFNLTSLAFIRHIGNLGQGTDITQFSRPMELCVSPGDGELIVVDGYNHRVKIIAVCFFRMFFSVCFSSL